MSNETNEFLPTRWSLLSRLKAWDDQQSWREFFDAYWKLIYSTALKAGLTHAEAQGVVQKTVIAIIAILASMLLPALARAKGAAHTAACLGNLLQLQKAWLMYADDHAGLLPAATTRTVSDPRLPGINMGVGDLGSWVVGHPRLDTNDANTRKGTLFPYLKAPAVFICPADKSRTLSDSRGKSFPTTRFYSLSVYFNGTSGDANIINRQRAKLSPIDQPSDRFTFVDRNETGGGGNPVYFIAPPETKSLNWGPSPSYNHRPTTRHHRCYTLAFADGHARRVRLERPAQVQDALPGGRGLARLQAWIPAPK